MPIKPENKARYPNNWKAIRAEILERAGHSCEKCGVLNRSVIARGDGDDAGTYMNEDADVFNCDTGAYLGQKRMSEYSFKNMVEIVLTIAHLDHMPENCDPSNLKAWCQRCHLKYDQEHHAANSRETRRAKKAHADLFEQAGA